MGQFSWLCACCGEQILSEGDDWDCFKCEEQHRGKEPVILLTVGDDDDIHEDDYEGYGVFGGVDAYSWLARQNGASGLPLLSEDDSDRGEGIDLDFNADRGEVKFPIKIVHARCVRHTPDYEHTAASQNDPDQGWQTMANQEGSLTICGDCL